MYLDLDSFEVAFKTLQQLVNTKLTGVDYINNIRNTVDKFDNDDLLMKRKKKLDTLNMQFDNVANFNDFAGIMPDMEIKLKLIEKYLREVFLPSS
ncbi:hypothetical protein GLOIN_2v1485529 [Rhizophagus clarus]|uniref:Uncharacterized protein n=1 Tax=Rhizophagus clarus TaxID=94130 RepID=A0A8H3QYF1_9GLOM|nr:hypothetical protein GLOIN_2v1485529 [Rhizophagus clarus]